MRFRSGRSDIERALRSERPAPGPDFATALEARLDQRAPTRRAWSKAAFASALSVFVLGGFASFGGIGYAANGAASAVDKVFTLDTPIIRVTSAADQYGPVGTNTDVPKSAVEGEVVAVGDVAGAQQLPFTGISLAFTAAFGMALIGAGVALRRFEKRSSS
jgi:hypothetical protein